MISSYRTEKNVGYQIFPEYASLVLLYTEKKYTKF